MGDFAEARILLAETQQAAAQAGNSRIEMACRLLGFIIDYYSGEQHGDWSHQTLRAVLDLVPPLEQMRLTTSWRPPGGWCLASTRCRGDTAWPAKQPSGPRTTPRWPATTDW